MDPFARFAITKKTQLTTKSDQWLSDAEFVYRAQRYAAALYLGGFVVECLLKAALWDRRADRNIRTLIYRSHDLIRLLEENADLARALRGAPERLWDEFVRLSDWTVRFRYNPRRIDPEDARHFMLRLREVREWLRSRV